MKKRDSCRKTPCENQDGFEVVQVRAHRVDRDKYVMNRPCKELLRRLRIRRTFSLPFWFR